MPLPFSGRPRESPPRPELSQPPLHLHRQPSSPTPRVPLFSPTGLPPSPSSIPLAYTTSPLFSPAGLPLSPPSAPLAYTTSPHSSLPQAFLHLHRQPPSPTPRVPPLLSRRPSSISTVSPPRLHHESPSSLPQVFLYLHRQPPSVFYPEGEAALGG